MERLACVLFHMDALYTDFLVSSVNEDLDETMLRQRPVVLRNLVAFGEVGIKVVLAGPLRFRVDLAVQAQRSLKRHRDGHAIQNRQRPRQTKAYRARVKVRRFTELRRTGAEELRIREQLCVTLEADHSLVVMNHGPKNLT